MQTGFTRNLRSLKKRSFPGQLVVTLLSCELLFFASFISVSLPTPTYRNLERYIHSAELGLVNRLSPDWQLKLRERMPVLSQPAQDVRYNSYVPIVPLSIALAYVLGFPLAVIACSLHFFLGIVGPQQGIYLFSAGGGSAYWSEPGFGYLIGIICGAWFAAWISPGEERKSWRQLLAAWGGVTTIHLIGLASFFGSSIAVLLFEGEATYLHFQPWLSEQIRNLSWYTLPYDLLFATMLVALSFPLRSLFSVLTSPDISHRQRPTVEAQLEVLQESAFQAL